VVELGKCPVTAQKPEISGFFFLCYLVYSNICVTFAKQNYVKMLKETKIGGKIFLEQTTYYVYASESHRQNDVPSVTTSSKKEFNRIKQSQKKWLKTLTPKQQLYLEIYDKVYSFKTKYPQGFINSEINELMKDYPDMDIEKFYDALKGITCMVIEGHTIIYHCDVENALRCGIEKRGLTLGEWD